jgi:hypothetical protein
MSSAFLVQRRRCVATTLARIFAADFLQMQQTPTAASTGDCSGGPPLLPFRAEREGPVASAMGG